MGLVKKILALALIALSLSNCVLRKNACKWCPITSHDSIVEKIVEVEVKLPPVAGPTVYLQSPCDSLGNLKPINHTEKKNGIRTTVRTVGNNLVVESNLEDSTKTKVPVKQVERHKSSVVIRCDNERTDWDIFCRIGFYIYVGLTGVLLLYLVLRNRLKTWF